MLLQRFIVHAEILRDSKSQLKYEEIEEMATAGFLKISLSESSTKLETITQELSFVSGALRSQLQPHVHSLRLYVEDELKTCPTGTNGISQTSIFPIVEPCTSLITPGATNGFKKPKVNFRCYVYDLSDGVEDEEFMESDEDEDNHSPAAHNWILPSKHLDELWDSLFFESDIKTRLMEYIQSALLFSERGVNQNLIGWNKVILLHGPPGSGKTSLCKALAQKATIRLRGRYAYGQLVEINSHSLFSKWFSESGKLVMKMFEKIQQLIEDPRALVFLLIDEVESLAKCRLSSEAGNEPADSIRAVNALLTQIDRMRRYSNVMVLATSNIVGSIDLAFVDRADLKLYIGPPPPSVIYQIYASSLNELIRVGIISSSDHLPETVPSYSTLSSDAKALLEISVKSQAMSGRTLRKIPFLTHANFVRRDRSPLDEFIQAMDHTVDVELKEAEMLVKKA